MSIRKDPSEVSEVADFLEAREKLLEFKKQHKDVFDSFDQLVEEYNQKRQSADKTCRAQKISCGPWDLYQSQTKYDAKVLFESLGRERFISVGGKTSTQTIYGIDNKKIEASIKQGLIPSDVVEAFRNESPRYHSPSDIEIP